MSILSTNHRLISIGESYSAGNGIDIADQVISVTGDATPYSAGENIDIQDHIISGKDWSQDITEASSHAYNETTAWVQENYANSADMTYISAVVDTKLDTSAWSSVSGDFATESYVIMSDNITYDRAKGYVDSQQFAKESACQSAFDYLNTNKLDDISFTTWQNGQYTTDLQTIEGQISNKLDESAFSQVSGSFLTAINIPESATWNEVSQAYEQASATYLTGVSIPESAVWQDVSTTVQTNSAQWSQGCAGDADVNNYVYNNSAAIDETVTTYEQNSASYLTEVPTGYAVESAFDKNAEDKITAYNGTAFFARVEGGGDMFTSYLEYNDKNQISGYNGSAFAGETLTGDAQGAVDTVYSTSGNIITGTKSDHNFTARNVNKVTFGNFTIDGLRNYIEYDRPGYPTYSWFISNTGFHLGPEFAKDYWENYARVWLERTGLSSMSGTKSDKKLIWRALLDNDVEGANNTITAIAGSALVGGVTGEFVPQSAFDELKASYDALSASYDALSSLFATYSGQWLLPNGGE